MKINNEVIKDRAMLQQVIARQDIGSNVKVLVNRYGKEKVLKIKIADQDIIEKLMNDEKEDRKEYQDDNISVKALTNKLKYRYKIEKNIEGVLVSKVKDDGDIDMNIEVGDVILQINEKEIKSINDFEKVVKEYKKDKNKNNKKFIVHIYRFGQELMIGSKI